MPPQADTTATTTMDMGETPSLDDPLLRPTQTDVGSVVDTWRRLGGWYVGARVVGWECGVLSLHLKRAIGIWDYPGGRLRGLMMGFV